MAINIFDKYGLKEVANVSVFALADDDANGIKEGDIVLFLDTLKVSTIEQTSESTEAQGGWGNPKLISWDYGKEINVTLTDALMSPESLRFMLGGALKRSGADSVVTVEHTEAAIVKADGEDVTFAVTDHLTDAEIDFTGITEYRLINLTTGVRGSVGEKVYDKKGENDEVVETISSSKYASLGTDEQANYTERTTTLKDYVAAGDSIRVFWQEEKSSQDAALEITISPNTFPGTYKFVGETFIRSQKTGKDEAYQFIIPKAKVGSEVTLTMEADGDPATFEMKLKVLRSENADGKYEMMKFVRY